MTQEAKHTAEPRAASPELLAALEDAEAELVALGADKFVAEGDFVPSPTLALRNVRAALATAKGDA